MLSAAAQSRRPLPQRLCAAVLALLLLATLAPGLSRMLAHVQGQLSPWTQLCVSAADRSGMADGAAPAERRDGKAAHAMDHCPLCALQPDLTAPLPPSGLTAPAPLLAQAMPALFLAAPRPLHAWATVQARAPPAQG